MKITPKSSFPLFLMGTGKTMTLLSMKNASTTFNNGYFPVNILGLVVEEDLTVRDITPEEIDTIKMPAKQHFVKSLSLI